jgi:hypothetical protein
MSYPPQDVDHAGAQRVISAGSDDRGLQVGMHGRFVACPESCADNDAVRAQAQRRRESAAVADATGGAQQRFGGKRGDHIGDFRYQRKRATFLAVSACFGLLGDQDVRSDLDRTLSVSHGLDLAEEGDTCLPDPSESLCQTSA